MMEIDTITDEVNADGKKILVVVGPECVRVLEDRVAKKSTANLVTDPSWVITDTPANIARTVFNTIVRAPTLSPNDKINGLQPGSIFSASTIPENAVPITATIEPQSVYETLKSLGEQYDFGFRLIRNFDTTQLYFDIYTGNDRTTSQTTLAPVVFAPELDNLQNTKELTTFAGVKNIAYVYNSQGYKEVAAQGVDILTISSFERRVLFVKADDLPGTPTAPEIDAYLAQRGAEELAKNQALSAFEGETNPNSQYQYGTDYGLGDLVEVRNSDGATNRMRVTEQIFVSDGEGDRSYPTLAINLFITPGSWLAWASNQVWSDLTIETWATV
jgi:hypothetical protein